MLNLKNYNFSHHPFPYVICKNIFSDSIYTDLTKNFPNINYLKTYLFMIKTNLKILSFQKEQ